MTSLLFSFFSYFSSFLNGRRNVLTDAQKRELFYDSPLTFAETLLSTTTLFRDTHTHTPAPHFSLFIKKKDSKGGDRGAMCNNSPWLPTPENTRKPTKWATRKKNPPKSIETSDRASLLQLLEGAFGVRRPFGAFSYFFRQSHCMREALFALAFFAEQLFYFLSFPPRNVFGKLLFLRPRQATHAPPICCCTFPTASSYGYGASIVMAPRKRRGRRPKTHFPPHTHSRLFRLFGLKNRKSTLWISRHLRPSLPSKLQATTESLFPSLSILFSPSVTDDPTSLFLNMLLFSFSPPPRIRSVEVVLNNSGGERERESQKCCHGTSLLMHWTAPLEFRWQHPGYQLSCVCLIF